VLGLTCVAVVARATVARPRSPCEGVTLVKLWSLQTPLGFTIAGFGVLSGLLSAPFDEQRVSRVGAATVIVLLLMLRRELMSAVLSATDFVPPAPAPLYLAPAMVLDGWFWLRRNQPEGSWRCVMAGVLFGGIFVATEYVFTGYLTGRFWPLQLLALSGPLAAAMGGLSAWAGARLGRWWLSLRRAAVR
jgi:hypothetical protein